MKIKWETPPEPTATDRLHERFWSKVSFTDKCWTWTAATTDGYGIFVDNSNLRAHRWSYEHCVGRIPAGLVIDHLCRVRNCVNPDHLEPVTDRVNVLRGAGPTAIHAQQAVCKRGHDDWYHRPSGGRQCRTCAKAMQHVYDRTRQLKKQARS